VVATGIRLCAGSGRAKIPDALPLRGSRVRIGSQTAHIAAEKVWNTHLHSRRAGW